MPTLAFTEPTDTSTADAGGPAILAATLSEADLNHMLDQLGGGRSADPGALSRFSALHARIRERETHLYNTAEANPRFSAPHLDVKPWQTDLPRRTWSQLRQRLTEHPLRVHVEPPDDSPSARQAAAGFPWDIEVIRPDQFAFVEDHGPGNGLALAVVLREVGLFEYRDRLREQDGLELRMTAMAGERSLAIARAVDAPQPEEPSGGGWGDRLRVASVWTRDEYYELAALDGQDLRTRSPDSTGGRAGKQARHQWTLIKSHPHPYEMPPFAIAEANTNDHPDMVHRWEPTMEGIYRTKPSYDYERALGRFLAEQTAIPLYWIQLADGSWQTDSDGNRLEMTPSAAAVMELPTGASLHRVEFEMEPAFVDFLRMSQDELIAAAPDSGSVERGEIGPNTQPHTLNLLLGSRNLQVQQLKRAQTRAVRTMLRNMALVMSKPLSAGGFGAPIWVFAKGKHGRPQRRETVCVDPSVIPSLDIDVWIDPYSSAQRIAVQEHGRARLNDPLDPLDPRAYLEQYIGEEHAEQVLSRHRQWRMEQARFERELFVARGGQAPEASDLAASGAPEAADTSGEPSASASSRLAGHLAPLGRLTDVDDDRTANP